jgi:hypothetical protein
MFSLSKPRQSRISPGINGRIRLDCGHFLFITRWPTLIAIIMMAFNLAVQILLLLPLPDASHLGGWCRMATARAWAAAVPRLAAEGALK